MAVGAWMKQWPVGSSGSQIFPGAKSSKGALSEARSSNRAWHMLGDREKMRFKDAQRVYLQTLHVNPAMKSLKEQDDLDVSTRSFTLQQVVWALALEVGSRVTPFHQ